jgi:cardiolipin synthase
LVPVPLTTIVVLRDLVIVGGAAVYRILIAPFKGKPTLISKLNTAFQLLFVLSTLTELALGRPARIVVVVLGAAVVFSSITSGLYYVVGWSKRAWRSNHAAA